MTSRTRFSKKPAPDPKNQPMALGPLFGLATVCLLGIVGMLPVDHPPCSRTGCTATRPAVSAYTPQHIYSETANPAAEIAAGLAQAKREHKRVILDFGGDWCGDCQVLDLYFHQPP